MRFHTIHRSLAQSRNANDVALHLGSGVFGDGPRALPFDLRTLFLLNFIARSHVCLHTHKQNIEHRCSLALNIWPGQLLRSIPGLSGATSTRCQSSSTQARFHDRYANCKLIVLSQSLVLMIRHSDSLCSAPSPIDVVWCDRIFATRDIWEFGPSFAPVGEAQSRSFIRAFFGDDLAPDDPVRAPMPCRDPRECRRICTTKSVNNEASKAICSHLSSTWIASEKFTWASQADAISIGRSKVHSDRSERYNKTLNSLSAFPEATSRTI